jgi:glycosyltransferase involved in cell wall biosynthesis
MRSMMRTISTEEMWAIPAIDISDETKLCREPLVTVFMLTYNHRAYIAEAIESVVGQRCAFEFELLIGDDCSTDGTLEICKAYQRKHPHIVRLVSGRENVGATRNSYRLVCRARGRYVAFCEGDDFWTLQDGLARRVELLERHPEASLCFANTQVILHEDRARAGAHLYFRRPPAEQLRFELDDAVNICERYSHYSALLVRRHLMRHPVWLARTINGDLCLVTLAMLQGRAVHLDAVTSVYRTTTRGIWTSLGDSAQRMARLRTYSMLYLYEPRRLGFLLTRHLAPLARVTLVKYKAVKHWPGLWRHREVVGWLIRVLARHPVLLMAQLLPELAERIVRRLYGRKPPSAAGGGGA